VRGASACRGAACGCAEVDERKLYLPAARGGAQGPSPEREAARARALESRQEEARARAVRASSADPDRDVTPWLRSLGCRADEARTLSEHCEQAMPDAPIEQKVRFALQRLGERLGRRMSFRAPSPA
jgi:hypothetical protein